MITSGEQGRPVHGDRSPLLLHLKTLDTCRHDLRPKLEPAVLQKRRRRYRHSTGDIILTLQSRDGQSAARRGFLSGSPSSFYTAWRPNLMKECNYQVLFILYDPKCRKNFNTALEQKQLPTPALDLRIRTTLNMLNFLLSALTQH